MWLEEMTLEVSWDAEVLGFLELGNSLTPGAGEQQGGSLWPGRGQDLEGQGPPLPCQCLGNRVSDLCPHTHGSATLQVCPSCFLQRRLSFLLFPLVPLHGLPCWLSPQGLKQTCGLCHGGECRRQEPPRPLPHPS